MSPLRRSSKVPFLSTEKSLSSFTAVSCIQTQECVWTREQGHKKRKRKTGNVGYLGSWYLGQSNSWIEAVRQDTHPSPPTPASSLRSQSHSPQSHLVVVDDTPILDGPCANNPHQLSLGFESLPSPRNNRQLCHCIDTHCPGCARWSR